jgi:CPA1 family monovalent cation:H+ antiporter
LTIFNIATGGQAPGHDHHEPARNHAQVERFHPPHQTAAAIGLNNVSLVEAVADPDAIPSHSVDHDSSSGHAPGIFEIVKLFVVEVGGGILLGLVLGFGTFQLLRSMDDYEIEVMITLACVMGGCSLAQYLHISGPLAMVVAGLIVGNDTVRGTAMSKQTETYVDKFWELMDILLNAILFVLIGLEILILQIDQTVLMAAGIAIGIVLLSRFLSLMLPVKFFAKRLDFAPHTTTIMTWGGLRGGISIALALVLPEECRALFLTVTYGVVVFSIIVQGLSVGKLARRLIGADNLETASDGH